jgi:hypothetical protein
VLFYLLLALLVQKYKYCRRYARLLRSRALLPPALAESIKQRDLGAQCIRFTGTKARIRTQKPAALYMLLSMYSLYWYKSLLVQKLTGTKARIRTQKPEALYMLLAESTKQRAQLTRFTGTKVQILTQKRYAAS